MELQKYRDGRMWHFPLGEFRKKREVYELGCRKEWKSREELESFAVGQNFEAGAEILGHISEETVQEWLGWNPGKLYVVGLGWSFVFCMEWGYIV